MTSTNQSALGIGIVGAGVISNEYLKNLTQFPDVDVRFIADLDEERAAEQARAWSVAGSGSYAELLSQQDVDIVVNLTIPAVHAEVAMQAVRAGKHVWGEKPYALDLDSARALKEAAEQAGVRVAVAPDTLLGAGLQTALREVRAGSVGQPLTGLTLFQVPGPDAWHPSPEFLFAHGAGPLFDVGPYYLTTLVQVFGPVSRVAATASQARTTRQIGSGPKAGTDFPVEVPTHVSALLEFSSGGTAQCIFSFDSKLPRAGFVEIAGTEGTVVFPDPNEFDGATTVHDGIGEARTVEAEGSFYSRGTGVAEMAQAIREGRPGRIPGELAFHVLDIMVSTTAAATSGQWLEVTSSVEPSPLLDPAWDPSAASAASSASATA